MGSGIGKQREERSNFFPALELRTAGWLLQCWATRYADPDTPTARRKELKAKVIHVQRAITAAVGSGKHADPPPEIACAEYKIVKRAVDDLYRQVDTCPVTQRRELIAESNCVYNVALPNGEHLRCSRPLFLDPEAAAELERSTNKSREAASDFAERLTADLFAIQADVIPQKLARARQNNRLSSEPTEAQAFLVSAFMLRARTDENQNPRGMLTLILEALFASEYDAKAIYHPVRSVSSMSQERREHPAWRIELGMCDETVSKVCRGFLQQGYSSASS